MSLAVSIKCLLYGLFRSGVPPTTSHTVFVQPSVQLVALNHRLSFFSLNSQWQSNSKTKPNNQQTHISQSRSFSQRIKEKKFFMREDMVISVHTIYFTIYSKNVTGKSPVFELTISVITRLTERLRVTVHALPVSSSTTTTAPTATCLS